MRIGLLEIGLASVIISCGATKRDFGKDGAGGMDAKSGAGGSGANGGWSGGGSSDAGAGSDSGAAGEPASAGDSGAGGAAQLSVVSVSPSTASATTRDVISVTFSEPVTQASVNRSIAVNDGIGDVAGELKLDGSVVRFQPHRSLCFDRNYTVSIADTVQTADAIALGQASSFSFRIPDGQWQPGVAIGPAIAEARLPNLDIDLDGNAVAAWQEGTVPALNYYDAKKKAWHEPTRPTFSGMQDESGPPVVRIRNGHAIVLFPLFGVSETADGQNWLANSFNTLLGSARHYRYGTVALASDDTAAFVWSDSYRMEPARLWSAFHPLGTAWQTPTTPFVEPETFRAELRELPDDSFLAVYERRLDQLTPGNVAARRYTKGKGWSSEKLIAAGGSPVIGYDSAGNALMTSIGQGGSIGSPVARYDYGTDVWTAMPDLTKVGEQMTGSVALSADGTGYVAYIASTYSGEAYYSHLGLRRLVGKKWSEEEIIVPSTSAEIRLGGIAVDDCGNVSVVWTDTNRPIVYTRRYTPISGWLSVVTLTKTSEYGYPERGAFTGNARGEIVVPYSTSDGTEQLTPRVMRFE